MAFFLRKPTCLPIVLLITVVAIPSAWAAPPVLTGRWGETCTPAQLASNYPSHQVQALVVVAFSTSCPLALRLVPQLNALQRQYHGQGIQLIGLFPNGIDDLSKMAEYALDAGLVFPVYRDDSENPWHVQLELTTTPSVAVLDTREGYPQARMIYRGQVSGAWFGGGTTKKTQHHLADALANFVAGEEPELSETAASGCQITAQSFRDLSAFSGATYYGQIARILQRSCLSCHRPGQPGAELFAPLDEYEMVAGMSDVILSRIENRLMPPWHARIDTAHVPGGFAADIRLTADEIDTFRAWVEQGCVAGDPSDAPAPLAAPSQDAWAIGTPDLVFEMPEPYSVPIDRFDEYQYYRIPANFAEDRYVQGVELKPGNPAIVHHMGAIIGDSSTGLRTANEMLLKLYGLTGDKIKKLGDYIPGDPYNAHVYPEGYALKLPAGHDIFFEMHYTPTGRPEKPDQSQLGLIWAPGKPAHVLETQVFNRKDLRIPPHALHYEKRSHYQFSTDVLIHALAPHMHFRGKDFTLYKLIDPGTPAEQKQLILKIPAYDFNWQRTYEFKNPLPLRAGDALLSIAHFDNSHYNPFNPDPEALVRFGLQSEQEMLNLRVKFERPQKGVRNLLLEKANKGS